MPTVRSSVLLPDMFEPLTTRSLVSLARRTSQPSDDARGGQGRAGESAVQQDEAASFKPGPLKMGQQVDHCVKVPRSVGQDVSHEIGGAAQLSRREN